MPSDMEIGKMPNIDVHDAEHVMTVEDLSKLKEYHLERKLKI